MSVVLLFCFNGFAVGFVLAFRVSVHAVCCNTSLHKSALKLISKQVFWVKRSYELASVITQNGVQFMMIDNECF